MHLSIFMDRSSPYAPDISFETYFHILCPIFYNSFVIHAIEVFIGS